MAVFHQVDAMSASDPTPIVRRPARVLAALSVLLLAVCSVEEHTNPTSSHEVRSCLAQTQTRFYFGLETPAGLVTDAAWEDFVDRVVKPRFAHGLTQLEASGQWRDERGHTLKESSRVVELVHADLMGERQAIGEIVGAYKSRFRQEAVLVTQTPVRACL